MNGLDRRRLSNTLDGAIVHLDIACGPDDRDEYDEGEFPCCMASAMKGPRGCTCWEPIFDVEQTPDLRIDLAPTTRTSCCDDCAYRNGSPERTSGYTEELVDVATSGDTFACHKGMRRAIAYQHPNGRTVPAGDGDYQPPLENGVAYKADGTPADLCGGWHATKQGAFA